MSGYGSILLKNHSIFDAYTNKNNLVKRGCFCLLPEMFYRFISGEVCYRI
jgi:hypothetical protein